MQVPSLIYTLSPFPYLPGPMKMPSVLEDSSHPFPPPGAGVAYSAACISPLYWHSRANIWQ